MPPIRLAAGLNPQTDPSPELTLSLLMLRVGTDDHNLAVTTNDLTFLAHRLD